MFEHRPEEQHHHYLYLVDPESLTTLSQCQQQDERISRYISDLESELEILRNLRSQNFSRMQHLFSLPWVPKVELLREKHYYGDGKVYYYLIHWKVYLDSTTPPEQISSQKYPGTDRRRAISDFNAYVKSHPGILSEMNIEKGRWER